MIQTAFVRSYALACLGKNKVLRRWATLVFTEAPEYGVYMNI